MRKKRKRGTHATGAVVSEPSSKLDGVKITIFDYDEENFSELQVDSVEQCRPYATKATTTWIDISGIHENSLLDKLADCFKLHPLTVEDILNTDSRLKIEDFDEYIFITLNMLYYDDKNSETVGEHISIILTENTVISFQEKPGDVFNPVRDRIRLSKTRIRKLGASYLAYSLVDTIIDNYFVVLEKIGTMIEELEDELIEEPTQDVLNTLHALKRDMIFIRKSVWPLREVIAKWTRVESEFLSDYTRTYLRDTYDHIVQAIEMVEAYRDMLAGMHDLYLSSISNRMNEIMKVLTIIATIFIPLTFIAGVYGMNFENMPELSWRWGYFAIWGIMLVVGILMLMWFRKKKWL